MTNAMEQNIAKCFSEHIITDSIYSSIYSPFRMCIERKDWNIYIPAQYVGCSKIYLDKTIYGIPFFARIPKNMAYRTVSTQTTVDFDGCVLDGSQKLLFIKGAITNLDMTECYVMPCVEYKDIAHESDTFESRKAVLLISKQFFKVKNALAKRLVEKIIAFITNTVIINEYISIQPNLFDVLNDAESFSTNLKSIRFVSPSMNVWGASKAHMEERMLAKSFYGDFAESKSGFKTGSMPFSSMYFINPDKDYKIPPFIAGKLSKAFIEIFKAEDEMAKSFEEDAFRSDVANAIQNEYKECGLEDLEKMVINRLETM